MEGLLRSIVSAGYRQLEGRGFALFRHDALSDSFPDSWTLEDGEIVRRYTSRVSHEGVTGRILHSGKPMLVADTEATEGMSAYLPPNIRSFAAVPVIVDGMPWGVLFVNSPQPHAFTRDDLSFVESLSRQIGAYLHESRAGSSGSVELSTVRVLAATVDAKDHYTRHHSTNVSFYARLIAREMNLDPEEARRVDLAGLLHDIGKIAIPDQILQKPGRLNDEERLVIQTHAAIGANILAQASHLQHLVQLVRHHHERWDGTGYPDGLKGNEIPLGAAILCLSDSFDTMTTRRVYRPPLSVDEALAEIRRCSGTQFHPEVAAALERVIARARFTRDPWLLGIGSTQEQRLSSPDEAVWDGDEDAAATLHRDPLEFLVEARRVQNAESLPQILRRAGQLSLDFWSADAGLIYLVDRKSGTLVLEWCEGAPDAQEFLATCRAEGPVPMARGLLGWAVLTNQGISVPDARRDPRWPYTFDGEAAVSVLVAPITANGNSVGVIQLVSRGESRFGKSDNSVMKIFTTLLGQAIDRVMTAWENREAYCTDPLTGVRNTNYLRMLMADLEQPLAGKPVSVAYLDGDDLKRVNDRHGHEAGDMVIQHMARCLSAWCRDGDVVVRYAGDEFLIFFPGLGLPEASARLERMRLAVSESPVELPGGYLLYVSVSAGITEIDAKDGPDKAVRAAEQAMYNAKRTGKNRVWTAAS